MSIPELKPNVVIAKIGDVTITQRQIDCNPRWVEKQPDIARGKSRESICAEAEQENFAMFATRALIDAAFAHEKLVLSERDIAPFRWPIKEDDPALQKMAEESLRIPRAVRRVYRGEDAEAVFQEELRPHRKMTLEQFHEHVAGWQSLERVEAHLAKDAMAMTRARFERNAQNRAKRALLRKRIEASARERRIDADAAADDYLRQILPSLHIEIFDDRFRVPAGREVFR